MKHQPYAVPGRGARRALQRGWRLGVVALVWWASACASRTTAFDRVEAAATRAYSHGRYEEAAELWLAAARQSEVSRDAAEARYRAAASLSRAGRMDQARRLYAELAAETQERSARSAFDLARLELKQGNELEGYGLLRAAVERFPNSGLAPRALEEYLGWLEDAAGVPAALDYLQRTGPALGHTELAERMLYLRARLLHRSGRLAEAQGAYLLVAARFPYPKGALWDDALWHAAAIEDSRGDYRAAAGHLSRMLRERETPGLHGSLERPRYVAARYRLAILYRDRLRDLAAARRQFQLLAAEHPTSRLRDDALWESALISFELGLSKDACSDLHHLVATAPQSRYVDCAHRLCPDLRESAQPCRDYLLQRIDQRIGRDAGRPRPSR